MIYSRFDLSWKWCECVKVAKNVDILYLEFSISVQNANSRDIVSNQPENYSFRRDISFILLIRKHRCFLFRLLANISRASIMARLMLRGGALAWVRFNEGMSCEKLACYFCRTRKIGFDDVRCLNIYRVFHPEIEYLLRKVQKVWQK